MATLTQQLETARRTIAQDQRARQAAASREELAVHHMKTVHAAHTEAMEEHAAVVKATTRVQKELDLQMVTHTVSYMSASH